MGGCGERERGDTRLIVMRCHVKIEILFRHPVRCWVGSLSVWAWSLQESYGHKHIDKSCNYVGKERSKLGIPRNLYW